MKIMEFTVKSDNLEVKVNLEDETLIRKYNENPLEFEELFRASICSLEGYFYSPKEIRPLINQIDLEADQKKIDLIRNYDNRDLN